MDAQGNSRPRRMVRCTSEVDLLLELHAAGLGVVDEVALELAPGLNVITGETGAGKSIIVGSLSLLTGARADTDSIRSDREEAEVEACFVHPESLRGVLAESGIPEGDEVVIARRIRKGTSRAWINGRMATVGQLAQIGQELIEIVGQHHARSLTRPASQRESLDRYAWESVEKARRAVEDLWDHTRDLARDLDELGADPEARAREVDVLRRQLAEIREIGPRADEDSIGTVLERLQNAGRLREEVVTARGEIESARDQIAGAALRLERTEDTGLAEGAVPLVSVLADLEAVSQDLRAFLDTVVDDPERLEAVRDRYVALRDLCRRFGPELTDVLDFASSAETRLADLERADRRADETKAALAEAKDELRLAAGRLSVARRRAAARLGRSVTARLGDLALPEARLTVAVGPAGQIERHGGDEVTFLFGAARDLEPRPLGKVASGGELSRVMLALASEIADLAAPPTIVFDEVDAGTGGEAATAVGSALSAQSGRRQLVCVTHLAQVAAYADNHIVVRKESATATADRVDGTARIVELSRMLSGSPESDRARQHAEELLALASVVKRNRPRNSIQ